MTQADLLNKKRKSKRPQPEQKEPGKRRANETEEEESSLTRLQDQIGNQATQQLLTQRRGDAARRVNAVQRLQQEQGNAYIQRVIAEAHEAQAGTAIQRQEAPRAGFNPLDPAVIGAAAQKVIAQNEAPVRRWLDQKLDSLR